MTFTIPNVFNDYYEVVDALIESEYIGVTITLYYEEAVTPETDSHLLNLVGGPNTNYGPQGNLTPYSHFGGTSNSLVETTETIRVRWYPDPKDWKKIANVTSPEVAVLMIGYQRDLPKLLKAKAIGDAINTVNKKYILASDPQKWGFGDKYFVAKLKQA